MRNPNYINRQHWLLAVSVVLVGCGSFAADDDRYDRLDKLRVLAIQSEPADIAFGETVTLSANVYEPDDRGVSYEWSWCPSLADGSNGFECSISEKTLKQAWDGLGTGTPAPSYDLGTDPEVQFTHLLTPPLIAGLCQAITGQSVIDEQVALACFIGLQPTVTLTVRTAKDEMTAIRTLTLLTSETAASERNANPPSNFGVTLRDKENDKVVKDGQALKAGHSYIVTADLDKAVAQGFTPTPSLDQAEPEERRETLVMSWFLTAGSIVPTDDGGFSDGDVRSTFVDGSNDFEDVTKNGWQLPLTASASAELHLVLRDERGGVGWTRQSFTVTGGEK